VIVYSVQSRTGVNVEPATLKRLSEVEYIDGVKEASGNIGQMAAVLHLVPPGFTVLSGDDSITIPLIALGGRGIVSVVSNEIPAEMTSLAQYALANNFAAARDLQRKYLPLMDVNFVESNPIPVKAALALMGLLEPVWRLPMCAPNQANLAKIEKVLEALGLPAGRSVHAG
jgi:4-hydroxy-tetrahydrodipicolinate synthase